MPHGVDYLRTPPLPDSPRFPLDSRPHDFGTILVKYGKDGDDVEKLTLGTDYELDVDEQNVTAAPVIVLSRPMINGYNLVISYVEFDEKTTAKN